MTTEEMNQINGGWKLFGKETEQGIAFSDANGCIGYHAVEKSYFLDICYKKEDVDIIVDCP